jgi:DNA adenine methylase
MIERSMSPVLKWAGGKTQLLENIINNMPKEYNRYYEPFVGGGAVFLAVSPKEAVLNDINVQLINLYQQLRSNHSEILNELEKLDSQECNKDFYYEVRNKYNKKIENNELDAECASLMIWLNKHCFNGLYRVNGKGLFNVPYNNRIGGKSADENNVIAISNYLNENNVKITCMDFEKVCESVCEGDFVYFDSPYIPESETADFTDYTKEGFSLDDHKRLAELFKKLDSSGAKLMLSNNDVPLVHSLYDGFNIRSLDVKRMINRNASKRRGKEVLVTNY